MNASDVLMYGHATFLKELNGFAEEDWRAPDAVGFFTVKDVVAHVASFEEVLAELLGGLLDGGPTPLVDQFSSQQGDDFNYDQVMQRRDKSVAEISAELEAAHEHVMELMARFTPEKLREVGTLPWYGAEYSLEDFLVYTYYGHKREHAAHIGLHRGRLGR